MKASFLLGLTGSIGMGKSTTSAMFAAEGIPVWDADAAVHRLYAKAGKAVAPIATLFPQAVNDGAVSRGELKSIIAANPMALSAIESIIHPLVAADRDAFVAAAPVGLIVLDIPLLFEKGTETTLDATLVVTAGQRRAAGTDTQPGRLPEGAYAAALLQLDPGHAAKSDQA